MIELFTYETPNGQKASIMLEEVGLLGKEDKAMRVRRITLFRDNAAGEDSIVRATPKSSTLTVGCVAQLATRMFAGFRSR